MYIATIFPLETILVHLKNKICFKLWLITPTQYLYRGNQRWSGGSPGLAARASGPAWLAPGRSGSWDAPDYFCFASPLHPIIFSRPGQSQGLLYNHLRD